MGGGRRGVGRWRGRPVCRAWLGRDVVRRDRCRSGGLHDHGHQTLLLLVGGTVADRFGARVVMLAGDGLLLLTTGVLAVVLGTPLWLLFAAAAAKGVVSAFYLPASSSMTRRLVDPDVVGRASALRGATSEAAEVVGSPIGGLLVAAGGFGLAARVDALSYVPIVVVMLVLRPRRVPEEEQVHQSMWRAAASGVVLVAHHPALRVAIGLTAPAAGAVVPVTTLLIPLVVRTHNWPPTYSGVLLAASSVSGIVVALLVTRLGPPAVPASWPPPACSPRLPAWLCSGSAQLCPSPSWPSLQLEAGSRCSRATRSR